MLLITLRLILYSGLRQNTIDFCQNTRSIRLPKFFEYLYWHMKWYTEYHIYVGVPCYNLGKLSEEIKKDMSETKSFIQGMERNITYLENPKTQSKIRD